MTGSVGLDVGIVIAAAFIVSIGVAVPLGRAIHRADHRAARIGPFNCPPWCVRERTRRLFGTPDLRGAHRHGRRT